MLLWSSVTGHNIATDAVPNKLKFSMLVTKIQKAKTKLTAKTIRYILTTCMVQ